MSTVIKRSALEFWGHNPAPDVAYVVVERGVRRVVTWASVMAARREWQKELLARKRDVRVWRAYKLWVAYFDQDLMGGWHAFLEDYRGDSHRIWVRAEWLESKLMTLFPLVPPVGNERAQWERWKPAFAKQFKRRTHHRRPLGVAYLWWDGHSSPKLLRWPNHNTPKQDTRFARQAGVGV